MGRPDYEGDPDEEEEIVPVYKGKSYELTRVINRMYSITRDALNYVDITVYKVLTAMFNNPFMYDISIAPINKDPNLIEKDLKDWETLVRKFGFNPEELTIPINDARFSKLFLDIEKALAFVWWLITTGRNRVIIFANSEHGLLPDNPSQLFGARLTKFGEKYGYSVSWVEILKYLLNVI